MHIQTLVRAVLSEPPGGRTDLQRAARFLEHVLVKRSVLIFVSDFLDSDTRKSLRRLAVKHDVIALRVTDPREERFPPKGLARIVDAERGGERLVRHSRAEDDARPTANRKALHDDFRRMAIDAIDVSTGMPYDRTLIRFFRQRIARMS